MRGIALIGDWRTPGRCNGVGCYSNPVLFVTGALEPAIYACAVRLDFRVVGGRCTEPAPVVWISAPVMSWCEIILEA